MATKTTETSAEPELAEAVAEATAEADGEAEGASTLIRKKDIYDHVTVATGLRKREVREAVDAMLAYMHSCLSEGKDMQVPPLGKLRVVTQGKGDRVKQMVKVNLQKPKAEKTDADDIAPEDAAD